MISQEKPHIPVMRNEIIKFLELDKGRTVLDCTVGCGGHADAILEAIGSEGRLVGIDQDSEALEIARNKLKKFSNFISIQGNFRNIDAILTKLKIERVDGIIFDLGLSSLQLDSAERGFSIRLDAPLDMRMDKELRLSAFDLVNFLPEASLCEILRKYGEERWHRRIARAIVRERKKAMIITTGQLATLVKRVMPYRYVKIHSATRTFQALRIAVNDELEALREALIKCAGLISPGGRICVICFHSLEDRIVKNQFRNLAKEGRFKLITKKPITPAREEIAVNPRARSAKLRVAERIK